MGTEIKRYEDWLALTDQERFDVKLGWNAYERESIGIPYTAAGRLAIVSERKILDLNIGTYHGGEYLIHATVSDTDFKDCPPMLTEEFEGFRIVWMPISPDDPQNQAEHGEGGKASPATS
jgi:hypothetical protein